MFFPLKIPSNFWHQIYADGRELGGTKDGLFKKKKKKGTTLVIQWLRLRLLLQWAVGSILGQGAKIPHALRPKNQNIKQKQYCNKFNKRL